MFSHQYAKSFHYRHDLSVEGIGDGTHVVDANIPLRSDSSGFDQAKVDSLIEAAVHFAKDKQVRLEFWSAA